MCTYIQIYYLLYFSHIYIYICICIIIRAQIYIDSQQKHTPNKIYTLLNACIIIHLHNITDFIKYTQKQVRNAVRDSCRAAGDRRSTDCPRISEQSQRGQKGDRGRQT